MSIEAIPIRIFLSAKILYFLLTATANCWMLP